MHIYLAARYGRIFEMQRYAETLEHAGHVVTSRWLRGEHDLPAHGAFDAARWLPCWAQEDYDDLCAAETVISFTEGPGDVPGRCRGGRHVELGLALALGKRCLVVGSRENVFHWLAHVEHYATWQTCVATFTVPSTMVP